MAVSQAEPTDEEVAFKVQSGEIDFFGLLVERYESKLRRYGFKFLTQKDDLDDVLQAIFLKAFENIKSFDTKRKFSPWLYRIAHNELINHLKKRKFLSLSLFALDSFFPSFQKEESERDLKEKEFDLQKQQEQIELCLNSLKPRQKELLILYYFEGLDYKSIAEIMRQPISTIGVRLKRAKQKVKQLCQVKPINN
ncbi:MAG: RNA polymerase sigma factor [bacterium]|nr:RNA polymerase sigma factor [bacterium]